MKIFHVATALVVASACTIAAAQQRTGDAAWQKFTNGPGRFSLLLPGTPAPDPAIVDASGATTQVFTLRQDGKIYIVVYNDSTVVDVETRLNQSRDSFLKSLPATLTSEHRFQSSQPTGSVAAVQFTCWNPGKKLECTARTFVHEKRGYMVVAVNVTGTGSSVDTNKVLDSFQILGALP